jgi:hypothetical protein
MIVRTIALALALACLGDPWPLRAQGQVFGTPSGTVQDVKFAQGAGGVVTITYDLVSDDPEAVFSVALEVSRDGGKTFDVTARSVTGDIGPSVRAGRGRQVVWQAGRDVESLELDRFRFKISAVSGTARPVARTRLVVVTAPVGATVLVDGTERGQTPLTLTDLSPGRHEVRVRRQGYLENRREVVLVADASETVNVALTAEAASTATQPASTPQPTAGPAKGGGSNKLLWVGLVAGGAAAAALAAGGGGGDDSPATGGGGGVTPPVTCGTFSFAPASLDFGAAGGAQAITVTGQPAGCTGGAWSFGSPSVSWFRVAPSSGAGPSTSVQVTADANTAATTRQGSVSLGSQSLAVTQAAAALACSFQANFRGGDGVPPGSANTDVPGDCQGAGCGTRNVDVVATPNDPRCTWRVENTPSWFAAITQPGPGSGSIVLQVTERNTTGRDRSAEFLVAGVRFTVRQCAGRC